jgi:MFS family permease
MNSAHRTVAAALLAAFTVVIDNTKINVALPTLAEAFAVDETALQWIVESYVLAFAALLLLGGAVADRFGPTATMRAGLLASRWDRRSRPSRRRRACWWRPGR